ncbi:MAG: hypothetical protein JWP78_2509 [Mucilaginibacter sp.]|nr:hypothetical protein [Mucilaginibacter sp.]
MKTKFPDQPILFIIVCFCLISVIKNAAVHAPINLAAQDGKVTGEHLLEAFISPTLEVMMTVEPKPLY